MNDELQIESRQDAGQRLTRKRVAERLGVSVSTVRRMEGTALHPTRENGINYFRLFDAGRDLRHVVAELEIPPRKVRALFAEWLSPDLEAGERNRREAERADQNRRDADEHEPRMRDLDERLARLCQGMV